MTFPLEQAPEQTSQQLEELVSHLEQRHESILDAWQDAVQADTVLVTASQLTLRDFMDGIPLWLTAFNDRLRSLSPAFSTNAADSEDRVRQEGSTHGSHRWEQGYRMSEVTREWGHLHLCLIEELEQYTRAFPETDRDLLHVVRRTLAQAINEAIHESVARYHEMQKDEAASQVRDLEQALEDMHELERARGEALRAVSHDLRGSLTVVRTATAIFDQVQGGQARAELLDMVQRSIVSLHQMLNDLMDLARLEAGQETMSVKPFDAAALLSELCTATEPLAQSRDLVLQTSGPSALLVEGDEVKVWRIAQNLLLNALNYTTEGSVRVSWATPDAESWMFSVEDSGPGLYADAPGPAARSARPVDQERRTAPRHGEGIGLSIVKRLCELLDARLELKTETGVGTTFQITFPRRYIAADTSNQAS